MTEKMGKDEFVYLVRNGVLDGKELEDVLEEVLGKHGKGCDEGDLVGAVLKLSDLGLDRIIECLDAKRLREIRNKLWDFDISALLVELRRKKHEEDLSELCG